MKVAALAALSVLIALPADAGERHRQNNVSPICDNDGRCATLAVTAPTSSKASSFRGRHTDTAQRKPHRALDANGNSMLVTVQTAYGFNITVHPAYASKFLKFFALLKERGYKVPANITRCWAPRGTHVAGSNHYIGAACDIQTGGIAGPRSSTTWTTSSNKLACTAAARSAIAVMSKPSVVCVTERPISTPRWRNSNQSNRRQTFNHEGFAPPRDRMNCGMSAIGT